MDADVIVVGAGNAGMSAALAARERGASVLVLEKAAREWSGGNSAFTAGATRLAHGGLEDVLDLVEQDERHAVTDLPPYTDFAADLERVTLGRGDPDMARVLVGDSGDALRWLAGRGVRFRLMYERQAHETDGRWTFWGGLAVGVVDGGRGLVDQQAAAAARFGIEVRHEAAVESLAEDKAPGPLSLVIRRPDGSRATLSARSVVLAAGGFESNPRLRAGYLGPNWDVAKVRGTPHNTGEVLEAALAAGAAPYGHWSGCHAIQWDAGAPPTGDLELTNRFSRQSYPVGIVVNRDGERFIDEGADFRNYTYAKYGAEVLRQPDGVAFQVFDARSAKLLRGIDYDAPGNTRVVAETLGELAAALRIDGERFERTVRDFNAAITGGPFDPAIKDGLRTDGLAVPKSNWALPVAEPPFVAFPVTCGITFTFGGLRVDEQARVLDLSGKPMPGLHACGELVGGLFFHNYPGGSGLTAGTVYGRRAGYAAATA
ncbi:FAD-dependent tricarballylate dehydrogenase TcuA [Solirubrobacter phytolaccae]|uniref:FAD-dependent tricarballylate dehydrogenase TcuA n=1 Tax=Solirubrobacter phytolaccae TaxID=1404360 RepID=A0A9X3N8F8_9ACTN|nr:FAD-dependent tricarballylate dehydrogenase TcuA [Solirubrobacter phytolaccae]MDA0180172.1 FAD-dependent tricarballylate dehydrogenase TcuA [Solirubrobacter phytolaccae]